MRTIILRSLCVVAFCLSLATTAAQAQPFGVELHNTMMPASGGMGGVSIAQPQDLLAAINGNPAALTRFRGTQFQFGGGWAEATYNMSQTSNLLLPGVSPFNAKSGTPGSVLGNIGMTQQFELFGRETVMGVGLVSNAGAGVDFRGVPASNGTSSDLLILEMNGGFGTKITDRLSLGADLSLGSAFFDGPFIAAGAMVPDYAIRGSVGLNYNLADATTLGFYYQTRQNFTFEDAIRLQLSGPGVVYEGTPRSIKMALPRNYGFGVANRALCDGRLLVGMDVLIKQWDDADLFQAIYRNQVIFQFGSQYSVGRMRLRAGYVYAENPLKTVTTTTPGGVPVTIPAVQYVQAQFASFNRNRISFGVGMVDIVPGLDFDFFAGGMFRESAHLGDFTDVSMQSYWIGLGSTYRFGRMGRRS